MWWSTKRISFLAEMNLFLYLSNGRSRTIAFLQFINSEKSVLLSSIFNVKNFETFFPSFSKHFLKINADVMPSVSSCENRKTFSPVLIFKTKLLAFSKSSIMLLFIFFHQASSKFSRQQTRALQLQAYS